MEPVTSDYSIGDGGRQAISNSWLLDSTLPSTGDYSESV
jgi:hypothetical protein